MKKRLTTMFMTIIFMLTTIITPLATLAEVNGSKENLAQGKIATQSSTESGGNAGRAVDGNTNGNYTSSSVSHTGFDQGAWWMVDLGANYNIGKINIFARTDGAPADRLNDYNIYVLDENQNTVWQNHQTTYPMPMTGVNVGGTIGRYVKVQLTGKNYLSLAEVQVYESEYPKFDKEKVEIVSESNSLLEQGAINMLDDDINTFWSTEEVNLNNNPAYVQFDLNNIYKLGEIRLTPRQYENGSDLYKDRPLNYNIYTSDDGENFNKVIDNGEITYGDFNDNSVKTIDLDSLITRYIKIEITSTIGKRIHDGVELSCVGIGEIDFIAAEEEAEDNNNNSNEAIIKDLTNSIKNNKQPSERNKFFKLRSNLTNSYLKFKNEKVGNVAFLGGSITDMNGWRNLTGDMLQKEFSETAFNFINAGIPSFDSTENAFRFDSDVLSKGEIDLLFIEAAVNDETNGRTKEEIVKSFEGVINQAYRSNPNMDIVIMYFVDDWKINQVNSGNTMPIIDIQDSVAEYYNVTAIDMATQVIRSMNEGEYTWNQFGGIHPSPFGHSIYAKDIENLLKANWATVTDETKIIDKTVNLPKKLIDENSYLNGKYSDVKGATSLNGFAINNNWRPTDGLETRPGFVNVTMLEATTPGASFTFDFKGTAIGILDVAGSDVGIIEYSVDGAPYKKIDLFTQWSRALHLPWAHMLEINLEDTDHTITIRTTNEKNPLSKGNACRIRNLLVNTHSDDMPKPPKNLALNKKVTASTIEEDLVDRFKPENIVDGNTSETRWSSKYNHNDWIEVDLGEINDINQVDIYWEPACGKQYKILTSLDGVNYTEVYHESNGQEGLKEIKFDTIKARYVKMQGVEKKTKYGYSIYELEVYGPKVEENIIVAKPRNLKSTEVTNKSVTLTWDAPDSIIGLVEYIIYKDGKEIDKIGAENTEYIANNLRDNTNYGFKVAAKYSNGEVSKPKSVNIRTRK